MGLVSVSSSSIDVPASSSIRVGYTLLYLLSIKRWHFDLNRETFSKCRGRAVSKFENFRKLVCIILQNAIAASCLFLRLLFLRAKIHSGKIYVWPTTPELYSFREVTRLLQNNVIISTEFGKFCRDASKHRCLRTILNKCSRRDNPMSTLDPGVHQGISSSRPLWP